MVYGLFIVSIVNAMVYLKYYPVSRFIINLFALIFGLFSVKEYFFFKRGISLTVSNKSRSLLERRFRGLTKVVGIWPLIGITILIAILAAIVELPCTAGFPVIWSNIMSEKQISISMFNFLLTLYLLVYLLDEIAILLLVVLTFRTKRITEKAGKELKLFSGLVMVYLSLISFKNGVTISLLDSILVLALSLITHFFIILSKIAHTRLRGT